MIGQPRCPSLLPSGRNCRGRNARPPKRFPASRQTLRCRPLQLPKAGGPELLRRLEKKRKKRERTGSRSSLPSRGLNRGRTCLHPALPLGTALVENTQSCPKPL